MEDLSPSHYKWGYMEKKMVDLFNGGTSGCL